MKKRPIVLCIMDGYGLTDRVDGNAVKLANTPNLDDLMAMYPTTTIKACGNAVGLPEGQMGNSEVGHMNIGAGRTVYQSLTLINKAITPIIAVGTNQMTKTMPKPSAVPIIDPTPIESTLTLLLL